MGKPNEGAAIGALSVDAGIAQLLDAGRQIADMEAHRSPFEDEGKPYIVLRNADGSERIEYLEGRLSSPDRLEGIVKLKDEDSFVRFYERHQNDSLIYATLDPVSFIAVFNDHRKDKPNWRDHRAVLTLAHSREWKTWTLRNGKDKAFTGNVQFAEWLEDQCPDIIKPEGSTLLQIALNFKVNESVNFKSAMRLDNGQVNFDYQRIVDGQAINEAGRKLTIPEQFTIEVPVFDGPTSPKYKVDARFRYRLGGDGKLTIWYELVQPARVVEAAFRAVWSAIEKGTKAKILYGTPE